MHYAVTNPATGRIESEQPLHTDAEIDETLGRLAQHHELWRAVAAEERAAMLGRVADLYIEERENLAAIMVREMGKPIAQALGEVDFVASIFRHYADNGVAYLSDEPLDSAAGSTATVVRRSIGAVLGIMPWNYPHYQVARFVAPNVMLGNTVLLKHAPQCPESALAIVALFEKAGAPDGVVSVLFADEDQIARVIAHPSVQGVSLTGSERAGAAVGALAGQHLKKAVLELGGSDPYIVLDDADVDAAVSGAVIARFANAGQACNSAKRIIVHTDVYDRFVAALVAAVETMVPGDPTLEDTFIGPLASGAAVDTLVEQVRDAVTAGATLQVGGTRLDKPGAWFSPAVLTGVLAGTRAYSEELFGPVAVVHRVDTDEQAIALANDSVYGLGAIVRSGNPDRAAAVAAQLEVGMVAINGLQPSSAALPFGGVKRSGFGRELGRYGMDEFVNKKLVVTTAIAG